MTLQGERTVKITSTKSARKYGNWYKDLLGTEFVVIMYDICAAEYTVKFADKLHQLPDDDITIVKDTTKYVHQSS